MEHDGSGAHHGRRTSRERDHVPHGEPLSLLTALGPHAAAAFAATARLPEHDHGHVSHAAHEASAHGGAHALHTRSRAPSGTTAGITVEDSVSLAPTLPAGLTHAHHAAGGRTLLVSGGAHAVAGGSTQPPHTARGDPAGSALTDAGSGTGLLLMSRAAAQTAQSTAHASRVQFDLASMRAARKSPEELKAMKRAVRGFYEAQNERIDYYESVEEARAEEAAAAEAALKRQASAAIAAAAAAAKNDALAAADVEAGDAAVTPSESAADGASEAAASKAADAAAASARIDRLVALAINLSFAANVFLLGIKVYAAASSNSLAVIASTVDSVMDLISGAVVWLSSWLSSRRNPYLFPIGKSRYEPLSIIIFAALMGAASLQLIVQGVTDLTKGFTEGPPTQIAGVVTYAVLATIIGVKFVLLLFCNAIKRWSTSVGALALDHLADIVTNGVPLIALLVINSYPGVWFLDPIAAICMSIYMVWMWADAAKTQIFLLTGQAATADEIGEITFLALTHSPSILAVDTVLAYQLGNKLQVEVDIVMDRMTPLEESHDVAESLQRKIEQRDSCERCFTHVDYSWTDHSRDDEHIPPHLQPAYAPPE